MNKRIALTELISDEALLRLNLYLFDESQALKHYLNRHISDNRTFLESLLRKREQDTFKCTYHTISKLLKTVIIQGDDDIETVRQLGITSFFLGDYRLNKFCSEIL